MIQAKAIADERRGELEIARREGVIDGGLEGVVRLVPGGRSPVQRGHALWLANRELTSEELPQERVVAIRSAVIVDQQGRLCKPLQGIG